MATVHVTPVSDLIEHEETDDTCPCGPLTEFVDGGTVILHHSLDAREKHEPRK